MNLTEISKTEEGQKIRNELEKELKVLRLKNVKLRNVITKKLYAGEKEYRYQKYVLEGEIMNFFHESNHPHSFGSIFEHKVESNKVHELFQKYLILNEQNLIRCKTLVANIGN